MDDQHTPLENDIGKKKAVAGEIINNQYKPPESNVEKEGQPEIKQYILLKFVVAILMVIIGLGGYG